MTSLRNPSSTSSTVGHAPAPVRKRLAPLGGAFFLGVILLVIAAALASDASSRFRR
jgi:hypothetical protein